MQLDVAVLQYQNQKLIQKLEVQKVEYKSLQNKYAHLKEKQEPYDITVAVVKNCWEEVLVISITDHLLDMPCDLLNFLKCSLFILQQLVNGLEKSSVCMRRWRSKQDGEQSIAAVGGDFHPLFGPIILILI